MCVSRSGESRLSTILWCAVALAMLAGVVVAVQLLRRSGNEPVHTVAAGDRTGGSGDLVVNRPVGHLNSADKPKVASEQKPATESMDEPAARPVDQPVDEPAAGPVDQPVDEPTNGPDESLAGREDERASTSSQTEESPEFGLATEVPGTAPDKSQPEELLGGADPAESAEPIPDDVPAERPVLTSEEQAALERMRIEQQQQESEKREAAERMRNIREAALAKQEKEAQKLWEQAAGRRLSSGDEKQGLAVARQICTTYSRTKAAALARQAQETAANAKDERDEGEAQNAFQRSVALHGRGSGRGRTGVPQHSQALSGHGGCRVGA